MNKKLRPIPFPVGSNKRQSQIEYLMLCHHFSYRQAVARISAANHRARHTPLPGERCGAITRRQTYCMCKALANGRCKLHGGLSTGPKTLEGKRKSLANLAQ
jgi:hypothetical protein